MFRRGCFSFNNTCMALFSSRQRNEVMPCFNLYDEKSLCYIWRLFIRHNGERWYINQQILRWTLDRKMIFTEDSFPFEFRKTVKVVYCKNKFYFISYVIENSCDFYALSFLKRYKVLWDFGKHLVLLTCSWLKYLYIFFSIYTVSREG